MGVSGTFYPLYLAEPALFHTVWTIMLSYGMIGVSGEGGEGTGVCLSQWKGQL